jgi:protein-L-isoaspartate(D-aspartate) O-methyltransferase
MTISPGSGWMRNDPSRIIENNKHFKYINSIMTTKEDMIMRQLQGRDISDPDVIDAMRNIDRENFIPENMQQHAYDDGPLPIGRGQTISQPYIVAYMAQLLDLEKSHIVLEVGTGCGYNAAVLSKIVSHVYSIEIIEWLADFAQKNLKKASVSNVTARFGDGYKGWPENAPFDRMMLTAAAPKIPEPLKEQLKIGGKILAPVNNAFQKLMLLEKKSQHEFEEEKLIPVRFVPMTGEIKK